MPSLKHNMANVQQRPYLSYKKGTVQRKDMKYISKLEKKDVFNHNSATFQNI